MRRYLANPNYAKNRGVPRITILLCLLALWLSAPRAGAQPAPAPEASGEADIAEAKRLFADAEVLRKAGDCDRAVVLYEKSRAKVASVPNTLNMAVCLRSLERSDEAFDLYVELLGALRANLTEEELASVAAEMDALKKTLGRLDVTGDLNAVVVVDGRKRGVLPLAAALLVTPGAHDVRLFKDGFEPFATVVRVKAAQSAQVAVRLVALTNAGRLAVGSSLKTGEVYVDGSPIGALPFEGQLAPGEHVVQVVGGDSGSSPVSVTVIAGQTVTVSPPTYPLGGKIIVATEPASATVSIGDVDLGQGVWRGRLPVGRVTIAASENGYTTARREIDVTIDDASRRIDLVLVVDESHPRWAAEDRGRIGIEAFGGLQLAPSLGSGPEASCDVLTCDDPLAVGGIAGVRVGYELPIRLGFELVGGFMTISKDVARSIDDGYRNAAGDEIAVRYELSDALSLRGGFVGGAIGYRLPVAGPFEIKGRAMLGVVFLNASDTITGSAQSTGEAAALNVLDNGGSSLAVNVLLAPEIDFDLRFGDMSFGVGLIVGYLALNGPESEIGDMHVVAGCDAAGDVGCAPGEMLAEGELAHGAFVFFLPGVHVGYQF